MQQRRRHCLHGLRLYTVDPHCAETFLNPRTLRYYGRFVLQSYGDKRPATADERAAELSARRIVDRVDCLNEITLRILFANELGGGLGHAHRLAPWVHALGERGGCPVVAVRDVAAPGPGLFRAGTRLIPAPFLLRAPLGKGMQAGSYAEILLSAAGYGNPQVLARLVRAWLDLMALCETQLLVADFAPTALLAARIRGIACVHIGDGYTIAPRGAAFDPLAARDLRRIQAADRQVVATVNRVLAEYGCDAIAQVDELQAAGITILATYPELDHHQGAVRESAYAGHFSMADGLGFAWHDVPGPRVLAYLRPEVANFQAIVASLARLPGQVQLYAGGMVRDRGAVAGYGLAWHATPLPVPAALTECDLVVCHGGHGLVCEALLAAKPVLIFPSNHEQTLTALNVERLGAALWVHPQDNERKIARALERGWKDAGLRRQAAKFALTHSLAADTATARLADHADRIVGLVKPQEWR